MKKNWQIVKFRCFLTLALLLVFNGLHAQSDTIADTLVFRLYRNKLVLYLDNGFNTAPFSIRFKDTLGEKQHQFYRNNTRNTLGIGFSYKWAALRLAFNLPGTLRPIAKFGNTNYFDIGFEFKTKKRFFDFDIHNYRGYAIKNAWLWNDSLDQKANPNYLMPHVNTFSMSLNSWRFWNKKIKMAALKGKTGLYLRRQYSFYVKTTFNLYGVSNAGAIVPFVRQNPYVTRTSASTMSAFDFGLLPGFLYVDRYKYFQYSVMAGFGGVIQSKYYYVDSGKRNFIGLAPRVDVRILCGFNLPKWFVMLVTEFDNKTIRFGDMRYQQTYYTIRIQGGMRF